MNWIALYKTGGLCLISILIEAASYTKTGKSWFERLRQPRYSISMRGWYMVGVIYYLIFGIITYRQFASGLSFDTIPVILLVIVMVLNGLGNFIIFKFRSIKWFYLVIYPFGVLLLGLIVVLLGHDLMSAVLASAYFLWLIYDLYYGYQLWQLNK